MNVRVDDVTRVETPLQGAISLLLRREAALSTTIDRQGNAAGRCPLLRRLRDLGSGWLDTTLPKSQVSD